MPETMGHAIVKKIIVQKTNFVNNGGKKILIKKIDIKIY